MKGSKAFSSVILVSVLIVANAFVASLYPNAIYASVALLLFIVQVATMYRANPAFAICAFPLFFWWATEFFSGAFIEAGALMIETHTKGEATGAFSRLAVVYSAFSLLILAQWQSREKRFALAARSLTRPRAPIVGERLAIFSVLAIGTFFVFYGLIKGFPLLLGVDRFSYRGAVQSRAFSAFLSNRILIFAVLGLIFTFGKGRSFSAFSAILISGLSFLYGEKFGSIVQGAIYFAMPWVLCRVTTVGSLPWRPLTIAAILIGAATSVAILLNYGALKDLDAASARFASRSVLQGQLWFLADRDYGHFWAFDASSISRAIRSLVVLSEQTPAGAGQSHGMYYVMSRFTDSTTMYWNQFAGGGFVFAHNPYWLMASGYVGMFAVGALTASLTVFAIGQLYLGICGRNIISVLLWSKVLVWLFAGYTIGNIWFFFGIKTIGLIAIGIAWDSQRAGGGSPIRGFRALPKSGAQALG